MTRFSPRHETEAQTEHIRLADEALARDPGDAEALVEAALAREEVWRYQEAIDLYTRGMALAPFDYRMPLGRAHRLLRLRRLDEARTDLERAKELDPDGFNTAYLGALCLYLLADFQAAAEANGEALARSSRGRMTEKGAWHLFRAEGRDYGSARSAPVSMRSMT